MTNVWRLSNAAVRARLVNANISSDADAESDSCQQQHSTDSADSSRCSEDSLCFFHRQHTIILHTDSAHVARRMLLHVSYTILYAYSKLLYITYTRTVLLCYSNTMHSSRKHTCTLSYAMHACEILAAHAAALCTLVTLR